MLRPPQGQLGVDYCWQQFCPLKGALRSPSFPHFYCPRTAYWLSPRKGPRPALASVQWSLHYLRPLPGAGGGANPCAKPSCLPWPHSQQHSRGRAHGDPPSYCFFVPKPVLKRKVPCKPGCWVWLPSSQHKRGARKQVPPHYRLQGPLLRVEMGRGQEDGNSSKVQP